MKPTGRKYPHSPPLALSLLSNWPLPCWTCPSSTLRSSQGLYLKADHARLQAFQINQQSNFNKLRTKGESNVAKELACARFSQSHTSNNQAFTCSRSNEYDHQQDSSNLQKDALLQEGFSDDVSYGTRHVIVLADFLPSITTTDLEKMLVRFKDHGVVIHWLNDTIALVVVRLPSVALEASMCINCPFIIRVLDDSDELLSLNLQREMICHIQNWEVGVVCLQETKWKGEKAKDIRGYKLWYSGSECRRNGVGIMVAEKYQGDVVEVKRYGDRIMTILLVAGLEPLYVICGYAPHAGLADTEKKAFWDTMDMVVSTIPREQKIFIGGDFNGHVRVGIDGYHRVHGGFGFGVRNDGGRELLDLASAHDLMVVNTFFKKKDDHLITFQNGGRNIQIDYALIRQGDRSLCRNCKVLPKEKVASQHLFLVTDLRWRKRTRKPIRAQRERILWKNLKGDTALNFRNTIAPVCAVEQGGETDRLWTVMSITIREKAKEMLGVTSGRRRMDRESWWWNDDIQVKVKTKQETFKRWMTTTDEQQKAQRREEYRRAKIEAKKSVSE